METHRQVNGINMFSQFTCRNKINASFGNVVNIAARLCDRAEDGEILVDKRARIEIDGEAQIEPVGLLDLKGIGAQVEAFKVIGLMAAG